jgi:peroxiredoxin
LSRRTRAEYLDIHGAGHMVAGDTNDPFASAVVNFLAPLAGRERERS